MVGSKCHLIVTQLSASDSAMRYCLSDYAYAIRFEQLRWATLKQSGKFGFDMCESEISL